MPSLLPIMWDTGNVPEAIRHIATPMVCGMISSTMLTLAETPVIHVPGKPWRREHGEENKH
ncbi:MAG: hypothetical protein WC023_13785 [Rhodocyclaceae bacterium]